MNRLLSQTNELKEHLAFLKSTFEKNQPPESIKDKTFFAYVKQQTDPIYQLLEQWETNALAAVKEKKANVHPQQIISTRENMGLLLMHSFYIDIRKRRYMEIYYSCMYVFDLLAKSLQENFTAGEE